MMVSSDDRSFVGVLMSVALMLRDEFEQWSRVEDLQYRAL